MQEVLPEAMFAALLMLSLAIFEISWFKKSGCATESVTIAKARTRTRTIPAVVKNKNPLAIQVS